MSTHCGTVRAYRANASAPVYVYTHVLIKETGIYAKETCLQIVVQLANIERFSFYACIYTCFRERERKSEREKASARARERKRDRERERERERERKREREKVRQREIERETIE